MGDMRVPKYKILKPLVFIRYAPASYLDCAVAPIENVKYFKDVR